MTVNSLSPAFMKLFYTGNGRGHVATIPITFSGGFTPGVLPSLLAKNGTAVAGDVAADGFAAIFTPFLNTGDEVSRVEYFSWPSPADDVIFIYAVDVAAAGESALAALEDSMLTMSFRTNLGGVLKFVILDAALSAVNVREIPPFTPGSRAIDAATAITDAFSCWKGRDGGYAIAGIALTTKTNDKLRRDTLDI